MKRILSFFAIVNVCLLAQAQTNAATQLLDKAAASYRQNGGVDAAFHIDVLEYGGSVSTSFDGTIQLKGSKFKLVVPGEMMCWFDGRNQWLYLLSAQEVNLSNPSEEELLQLNPVNVFLLYQHGFDARLAADKTWKGKSVQPIVLTPADKSTDLRDIEVYFDKKTHSPVHIRITNKDLSGSVVEVVKYVSGKSYPEAMFVFPQKDYPMAEVIDLR